MNYGGLFESWEIAVAKKVINDYRRKQKYLGYEDFDDLLQECLIRWLEVRDKYDPGRGSKKTFMAEVVGHVLGHVARDARRDKRRAIYESVSLDQPLNDDEDAPTLKDKIPDTSNIPSPIDTELKLELSKAYKMLTPQQQKLCRLLGEEGLTVAEASRRLNKHRMIIYREIVRIRELFEKEGLKDYLK